MPTHSRHSSTARQPDMQTPPAKHKRFASLLRLPSSSKRDKDRDTSPASSPRAQRASINPTTPTAPAQTAPSASASYFSPQPGASASLASKRPPASFSGHGIDNSRGPPVTLVTRGNSDYARKKTPSTTPTQPLRQHSGLPQPIAGLQASGPTGQSDSDSSSASEATAEAPQARLPMLSRSSTATTTASSRTPRPMASSIAGSSDFDDARSSHAGRDRRTAGADSDDLFMNIAEDTAPRQRAIDAAARQDRLRSRIARVNNRHSSPSGLQSASPVHAMSAYTTPSTSRIPFSALTDPKASALPRRATALPVSSRTNQPPLSPTKPHETLRTRLPELNPKASFSSRRDAELSPREFLASMRRPSHPDALQTSAKHTPTHAYRPSNLNYTSTRTEPRTPQPEPGYEAVSHHDGTESHGSTGPAASVWDELDELKTRIRKIEQGGGKTPATSNAAVAQASADRPRTANTSATTVSSSPHQQRKPTASPSESTVDTPASKAHPLLREALAKAKQHTSPSVYRVLESTATEALTLAEMSGSTGMMSSAASIYSGAATADRQIRRKADNICRGLTELCIAMCEMKQSLPSPAIRSSAAIPRRPSVQVNGESPKTMRDSEENGSVVSFSGVSPSRALERIEARRSSMLAASTSKRDSTHEPLGSSDIHTASRMQRTGTNLSRTRPQSHADADEDEDDTLRAPSRAVSDFRQLRNANTNNNNHERNKHISRLYTSQEPMPELQPSPALPSAPGLRRPTVTGVPNEHRNSLLFRESTRGFNFDRQSSPAVEKQTVGGLRERLQLGTNRSNSNRNTIGAASDLSRSVSLSTRRLRGASTGE